MATSLGLAGLALGYFAWYVPYSALTKALSSGLLPGLEEPVSGFLLLPAAALGTLVGMPVFLAVTGWWRYAGRRRLLGLQVPSPTRVTLLSGLWASLIIATTTLNYTFVGVSILFMLLLMRGGVLILSPIVDSLRRRQVHAWSWAALGLSLLAVAVALADVSNYHLTLIAGLSVATYLTGYIGRFTVMSAHAKRDDELVNRRYFVEEHMSAPVLQVALLAALALIGQGQIMRDLREGFGSFLLTPAAGSAFVIGLLYEGLFVFGTLIYLDRREYSFCVPANRCSSLLAGGVASFGLAWLVGLPVPSPAQLAAAGIIVCALVALSYPTLVARRARAAAAAGGGLLLFVCGGNTCRSPIAAAIARAELAARAGGGAFEVRSAGLDAQVGAPMAPEALVALRALGVDAGAHAARALDAAMVERATAVFCMTVAQREAVLALTPGSAGKVFCLDPDEDVPDPLGEALDAYQRTAARLRAGVRRWLGAPGYAWSPLEGA